METMFQVSRAYFAARAVLARIVESPFVRFAALLLFVAAAWRLLSPPAEVVAPEPASLTTVTSSAPIAPAPPPVEPTQATGAVETAFDRDLVAWWVVSAAAPGNSGKIEALEHLHGVGKAFNGLDLSCRRMNGLPSPDVTCANGAYLKEVDLGPVEGRPVDLSQSDLSGANLESARLPQANLRGAVLSRASLLQSDLSGADLAGSDLTGARLGSAQLGEADLTDARMEQAELDQAAMPGADLTRAQLLSADLVDVDLTGADLSGADLTGARLAGATLTGANFRLATLNGTEVSGVDFEGVEDLGTVFATDVWAWADREPLNLPASLPKEFRVDACAPGEDDLNRRAYEDAVKTGAIVRGKPPNC